MKRIAITALLTLAVAALAGCGAQNPVAEQQPAANKPIKIGIITDLTGSAAAYWGIPTRLGAELAKKELESEGYQVDLLFEDYQLDANKALTSAKKLVEVDNVDALYVEFNPAAVTINPYIKDKSKLFVYDAAATSPLRDNPNAYKTYFDYQAGCRAIAQKFKDRGITKMGLLKLNLEAGELCYLGVKQVYGDNLAVESYNLGDTDFKTQLLKLKKAQAGAVINIGYEGETLNALKGISELRLNLPYGTIDDSVTENVTKKYGKFLKGGFGFGFMDVSPDFIKKIDAISSQKISSYYGAALAYTHIRQVVKSLANCKRDLECVRSALDNAAPDDTIGFQKFSEHIADLKMIIKNY